MHWPELVSKKYTLTPINGKRRLIKNIHWPVLVLKKYKLTSINDKKKVNKK